MKKISKDETELEPEEGYETCDACHVVMDDLDFCHCSACEGDFCLDCLFECGEGNLCLKCAASSRLGLELKKMWIKNEKRK